MKMSLASVSVTVRRCRRRARSADRPHSSPSAVVPVRHAGGQLGSSIASAGRRQARTRPRRRPAWASTGVVVPDGGKLGRARPDPRLATSVNWPAARQIDHAAPGSQRPPCAPGPRPAATDAVPCARRASAPPSPGSGGASAAASGGLRPCRRLRRLQALDHQQAEKARRQRRCQFLAKVLAPSPPRPQRHANRQPSTADRQGADRARGQPDRHPLDVHVSLSPAPVDAMHSETDERDQR